jgi:hypothetical protein
MARGERPGEQFPRPGRPSAQRRSSRTARREASLPEGPGASQAVPPWSGTGTAWATYDISRCANYNSPALVLGIVSISMPYR